MLKVFRKLVSLGLSLSLFAASGVMSAVNAEDDILVDPDTVIAENGEEDDGFVSGNVNERGMYALYDYAYWNSLRGSIKMSPQIRGGFDCYWKDVDDCLFMTGEVYQKDKSSKQRIIGCPVTEYRAVMDTDSDYFFGAYCWFTDPQVEIFIIDDWGVIKPEFDSEPIGSVESDGGTYDIYRKRLMLQPALYSANPIYSYYFVRTEKRSANGNIIDGKISIGEHLDALKKLGVDLGYVYEVMLAVEGFGSSGSAHILKNDLYTYTLIDNFSSQTDPDFYSSDSPFGLPDDGVDVLHDTVFTDLVTDERDGYYFNLYKYVPLGSEGGDTKLELLKGGAFKCEWDKPEQVTFERGLQYYNSENATRSVVRKFNNEDITIEYGAKLESDGPMWAGGYGWLNTLGIEYFIVEAWKDWHVPDNAVQLGTVRITDDVVYDLYETPHNGIFSQIWSVRRDNQLGKDGKAEGVIHVSDHLSAWEKYSLDVADPDFVTFSVTGLQSGGKAEVYKNVVKIDGEDIYIPSEEDVKPAPKYVPGDLNGDFIVNSFDVIIARRELIKAVNGEATIEAFDIDCSGSARINDLVLITKLALGDKVTVPKTRPNTSK